MKKKCIAPILFLLTIPLISGCGAKEEPADAVTYYLAEYANELAHPGGMTQRIIYTYDEQWRVSTLRSYFGEEEAANMTYSYSADNTVATSIDSVNGTSTEVHRSFDEKGNIIRMEQYDDGVKTMVSDIKYNEDNQKTEQFTTYFNHAIYTEAQNTYTYDSHGNMMSDEYQMALLDGTVLTSRTESKYDSLNQLVEESHYTDDILAYTYRYTYDEAANTQTRTSAEEGASSGKLVYTYDDFGNLLTLEAINADGSLAYCQRYRYIGTDGSEVSALVD